MTFEYDLPAEPPTLEWIGQTLRCGGYWQVRCARVLERQLAQCRWPADGIIEFDLSSVRAMDTGGAWLLYRSVYQLREQGREVRLSGLSEQGMGLLALVEEHGESARNPRSPVGHGVLEGIGRRSTGQLLEMAGYLAFVGELTLRVLWLLLHPWQIRLREVLRELAAAGHRALPIVGLLSFLIGIVIAYQGGVQLQNYGANVFVADLVGLSVLRELAPLITAIIVAGRTGSAYTAQVGTMQVTEEVDALRAIGIAPMDLLVVPKLLALLVALPLLTVYADIMGLFGGLVMSGALLGISSATFIDRLAEAVSVQSYLIGVGKAPVFAAIVASVGCFQGFQVAGSAESVGLRTTMSVVQSIFLVIVVDAAFSVAFSWLGI